MNLLFIIMNFLKFKDRQRERTVSFIIGRKRYYHSLSSYLSSVYNENGKLMFLEIKKKLRQRDIHNQILDNINMIESTMVYW